MTDDDPNYLDFPESQPVSGQLLADRMQLGPLSAEEALHYAIDIGAALNKAHARGMVHGYLSPYSIVISSRGAVLLAPRPDPRALPYRAPEQVRGEQPDSRSDVFAFGALLYQMAVGHRAFPGDGAELDYSILKDPAPTLTLRSPIYNAMARVVAGCLEKQPGARRQRIQNAVTELRFSARSAPRPRLVAVPRRPASPRESGAPAAVPGSNIEPPPSGGVASDSTALPLKPHAGSATPLGAPGGDQFSSNPGESAQRVRPLAVFPAVTFRDLFGRGGRFSFGGFRVRLVAFIGACIVVLAGVALAAALLLRPKSESAVVRFAVNAPEHTAFPGSPAISPDGKHLAFSAQGPDGRRTLWLRPLDAIRSTPIAGTEGATNPFWSPDGQYLAYFAAHSLRAVRLKDLATETICAVEGMNGGGAWNRDGQILFSLGPDDGLYRVAAKANSAPVPVLRVNPAKNETGYLWPQFLPDHGRFLFFVQTDSVESTGVYAGALNPPERRLLFAAETNAVYSALPDSSRNGYLLYMMGRKLMGQAFNAAKLELVGQPMALADEIGAVRSLSLAPISVAGNGALVYQSAGNPTRRLVWLDRKGNEVAEIAEAGEWGPARMSHDGRRAVVARMNPNDDAADLWTVDPSGKASQITATMAHEGAPVWSPDGGRIACFIRGRADADFDLYVMAADGGKRDLLYRNAFQKNPTDWSRDGRYIFFNLASNGAKWDVWAVSTVDRHAGPILDTVSSERDAVLSPDGRWLAYSSDDNGRLEVYVQAFDGVNSERKRRWKISSGGGGMPKWSADGKELFFITSGGRVMSTAVRAAADAFETDPPVKLFQTRPIPKTWNFFEPSPDGQRFLVNLPLEWANASQIMVVTNWTGKLKD